MLLALELLPIFPALLAVANVVGVAFRAAHLPLEVRVQLHVTFVVVVLPLGKALLYARSRIHVFLATKLLYSRLLQVP